MKQRNSSRSEVTELQLIRRYRNPTQNLRNESKLCAVGGKVWFRRSAADGRCGVWMKVPLPSWHFGLRRL